MIKKSKGTHVIAICPHILRGILLEDFAREGIPFEKNKLVVRLASSFFLYNHKACKHDKAHLIHKNKLVLSTL